MRQTMLKHLRTIFTGFVIAVQVTVMPAAVFAQESTTSDVPPAESEQTQPVEAASEPTTQASETTQVSKEVAPTSPAPQTGPTGPTGPQQPTGSASKTYTLNPETGLYENDHYTWDPVTQQTKPKQAQKYSYNPATGMWDTTEWYYSPEQGKYLPNTISTTQNPAAANLAAPLKSASISNTGPSSNNTIGSNNTTNGNFDLFFDASISNKIGQLSRSGDAIVQGNTLGGNALTGDALALLNLLNMLQSSWGSLGSEDVALFMANIDGDVTGDLMVDPNALSSTSNNTNLAVSSSSSAAIDNDIDVEVASGNASVSGNTTGGDATSGNARAIINLINLINSAISANKSFVGILNINGNLNGDILLPPDMIKAIIAASGPNSNNQIQNDTTTDINVTIDETTTINNAITADAGTGDATVSNNTTAGSATSGQAQTNIVLLNLTGQQVVAKNALLVFVNVMGSWVGLIFDAPAGTTAVAATGPNSNNTVNSNNNLTVDVDATSTNLINNDVNVSAQSGDATVTNNTTGGNAKSGDASVGVNVLNMVNSDFNVSDWFGVLFINVFGNWVGSFGVNTEAGNQPVGVGVVPLATTAAATASTPPSQPAQTFQFVPRSNDSNLGATAHGVVAGATDQATPPTVLSSANAAPAQAATVTNSNAASNSGMNIWIAGIITLVGALMLGGERLVSMLRSRPV